MARITEELRQSATTGEQTRLLKNAFAAANEKMHNEVLELRSALHASSDPAKKTELVGKLNKLLDLQQTIRDADLAESSLTGYDLGSRRGLIDTGSFRDMSPKTILEQQGVNPRLATPEQTQRATDIYLEALAKRVDEMNTVSAVADIEKKINATQDVAEALRLHKERELLKEKLAKADPDKASALQMGNRVLKYLNEYIISTVFTTKTLLVNVIPSAAKLAYRPALDYVVKGASPRAFREMATTYSAFASNLDQAFKAASFSFKVERGLLNGLTSDVNKVLEERTMFKGTFGRYLRFFPRVLGATDELFGQLQYRAFVVSQATGEAYDAAISRGLKGTELEEFINKHVAEAVEQSFTDLEKPSVIDFLRQTGAHNYGLSGPRLDAWIKQQLDTNPELFQQAASQAGRDYANDLAFKREFSGNGAVSQAASAYERFVNDNPWMRLMGQLFFRTPVRVFEEGFRLTAGLNLITPNFLRDLQGKGPGGKGGYAQVRAQGEALLSFGIATAVMSLYAQGMITGGGPKDYRQRRSVEASKWNPYTIRFKDGTEFSFRNLDPFSTPLKIIANALDEYSMLQVRKAQGEYLDKDEAYALAHISAGAYGIVQALKDASLAEGIDQLSQLAESLTDPENKEDQLIRFLGKKAQLLIPNQWTKAQQWIDDPAFSDPATIEQFIEARINPSSDRVPKRYDAMGFPISDQSSPMALITGIDLRIGDKSKPSDDPIRDEVAQTLADLTVATGKHFQPSYDAGAWAPDQLKGWKGIDLRAEKTKDGKETYYDRLQRYVSESGIRDRLYVALAGTEHLPTGTPSHPGKKVEAVTKLLDQARKQAFVRLVAEESRILEHGGKAYAEEWAAKMGLRDVRFSPYK